MKTLKAVEPKKIVTWSLVVMFSFLQIVPTGWAAARPADELKARGVSASVDALANSPATPKPAPAPQRVAGFVDSTVFQLNENPLSPATPVAAPFNRPVIGPGGENPDSKPVAAPFNRPVIGPGGENPNPTQKPIVQHPDDNVNIELTPSVQAKDTTVITDPATGKELSVTIDERGIATVRWGDKEYRGVFDPRTNSVLLVADDNSIWTVQFGKKEDGSLYLQTFKTEQWSKVNGYGTDGYAEEIYTFNEQGQLTRKEWLNETGVPYSTCMGAPWCYTPSSVRSGGMIDYVMINGKTLVSHEKIWSENNKHILYEYNLTRTDVPVDRLKYIMPRYPLGRTETESWYSYDSQGNLLAKNWNSTNSYGGSTFGQEIYVHINGRDLVSVRRVWQYGQPRKYIYPIYPIRIDDPILFRDPVDPALKEEVAVEIIDVRMPIYRYSTYHSETYYSYDVEGNMIGEVNVWEGYDYQGQRHTGASYWRFDARTGTWETASAEGLEIGQIRTAFDWKIIAYAAQRKTVYVGATLENRWNYTHRVEFTRNPDGSMTAKAVYDNAGHVSIVVGYADVLSGETNDILLVPNQVRNGQRISYQEYWHADANGNWVSDGYRLVFTDQNTGAQAAVDFPAQDVVTLNGVAYKVTIDQDGILTLQEVPPVIPSAVQAFIDRLLQMLGKGWNVAVSTVQEDGTYGVSITRNCPEGAFCAVLVGSLGSLGFRLNGEGGLVENSVTAVYSGLEKVDVSLIFEGLNRLLIDENTHCGLNGCETRLITPEEVLAAMAQIHVNGVDADGTLHFQKDTNFWKAYRLENGRVIVERDIPPAVRAYVDYLKQQLGPRFNVYAQPWYGEVIQIYPTPPAPFLGYELWVTEAAGSHSSSGQLTSMRVLFNPDGTFRGLAHAFFEGVHPVDSQLLFEAVQQLPDPRPISMDPNIWALKTMAQLTVNSIDPKGAIHFKTTDGTLYKAYRDAEGKVVLEKELPPVVQAYVDQLNSGMLYKAKAVRIEGSVPPQYQISVVPSDGCFEGELCLAVVILRPAGVLGRLNFVVSGDGTIDASTLKASYVAVGSVNAQLLYEAMGACPVGQPCPNLIITPMDRLTKMTQITVSSVDANGAIHFTKKGASYKCYRDANGKVILERELPSALQQYVDALKKQLGDRFLVTATLQKDGTYLVHVGTVNSCPEGAICASLLLQGAFWSLEFNLTQEGDLNRDSIKANYNGIEVDGKLLFEVMAALEASFHPAGSEWMVAPWYYTARLVALATQIIVKESSENLLRFDHKGTSYKAYRDAEGKVVLEVELTPEQKAIEAVKANLAKLMGLSAEALDALIESITVDEKGVLVKFKEGKMGEGRLIEVLGNGKLPTTARFHLDENQTILSARLEWGNREGDYKITTAQVRYVNGRIARVDWTRETGFYCAPGQMCPMYIPTPLVEILGSDFYVYSDGSTAITISRGPFFKVLPPNIWQPASVITLQKMEDGQFHISEVKNYKDGKLVDVSRFDYLVAITHVICVEGAVCAPPPAWVGLFRIVRKDANGNLISVIHNIFYSKFGSNDQSAIIDLPNGLSKEVEFASFAELLDLARQFEQENTIPPAVQAYADELKKQLGPRYLIAVKFFNGAYKFEVKIDPNVKTPVASDELNEMGFVLSKDGKIKADSLSVSYGGFRVDARLLFEGMKLLELGIPENTDIRALALLSRIRVNKIVNSVIPGKPGILFEYQGAAYRVYRDVNNNVILEQEIQASPELVNRAQSILGGTVVKGVTIVRFPLLDGSGSTTYFYDAEGKLVGSYFTNGSLGPNNKPTWRDADGRLVAIERWENDYKIIEHYNPEGSMTGLTLTHPDGRQIKVRFETPVSIGMDANGKVRLGQIVNTSAIAKAVMDLFDRSENVSEVVLKKYETFPGMCTMDIPTSHCSELIHFDLASPTTIYQYEIQHSWSDRDGTNTYTVHKFSRIPAIPPAVQHFIDQLSQQLGNNYAVTVIPGKEAGTYLVSFTSAIKAALQGHLGRASFLVNADGSVSLDSVRVSFVDVGAINAQLLFEGLKTFAQKNGILVDVQALVLMAKITVNSVDMAGAIHFTRDGVDYKCYRDVTGKVILEKELPPPTLPDIPGLPKDSHLAWFIFAVADHFGISVDDIVSIQKYEAAPVCFGPGCASWSIYIEMTVIVDGEETSMSGTVNGPAWDLSFSAKFRELRRPLGQGSVAEDEKKKETSAGSLLADLPLMRWLDFSGGYATVTGARSSFGSAARMPVMSSLSLQNNVAGSGAVSSVKASRIFGFEQNNFLFGDLMPELTK